MKNIPWNRALSLLVAFALVALVGGCKDKSRPSDLPDGVPCVVSAIQDGAPLEGAEVQLVALDEANKKYSPSGRTDANGDCEIFTYGYPGVAPGKYKVLVWKDVEEGGETETAEDGSETYVGGKEFRTVDPIFFNPETTTLEIEVVKKMEKPVLDVGEAVRVPK